MSLKFFITNFNFNHLHLKTQGRDRDTSSFNSAFPFIGSEKQRKREKQTSECSEWTPRENADSS